MQQSHAGCYADLFGKLRDFFCPRHFTEVLVLHSRGGYHNSSVFFVIIFVDRFLLQFPIRICCKIKAGIAFIHVIAISHCAINTASLDLFCHNFSVTFFLLFSGVLGSGLRLNVKARPSKRSLNFCPRASAAPPSRRGSGQCRECRNNTGTNPPPQYTGIYRTHLLSNSITRLC